MANDSPSPLSLSSMQSDYSTSPTFGFGKINPLSVLFGSEMKGMSKSPDIQGHAPLVTYNKSADVAIIDTFRRNVDPGFIKDDNDRLEKDKNVYNNTYHDSDRNATISAEYPATSEEYDSDRSDLDQTGSGHSSFHKPANQQELLPEHDFKETPVIIVDDVNGSDDIDVGYFGGNCLEINQDDSFDENESALDQCPVLQETELDEYKTFFGENDFIHETNGEMAAVNDVNLIHPELPDEKWIQSDSEHLETTTSGNVEITDPYTSGEAIKMDDLSVFQIKNGLEDGEHIASNQSQSQSNELDEFGRVIKSNEKSLIDVEDSVSSPDVDEPVETECTDLQYTDHRKPIAYDTDNEEDKICQEQEVIDEGTLRHKEEEDKIEKEGTMNSGFDDDISLFDNELTPLITEGEEIVSDECRTGNNENPHDREVQIFNSQTETFQLTTSDGGSDRFESDQSDGMEQVENKSVFTDQNNGCKADFVEDNQISTELTSGEVEEINKRRDNINMTVGLEQCEFQYTDTNVLETDHQTGVVEQTHKEQNENVYVAEAMFPVFEGLSEELGMQQQTDNKREEGGFSKLEDKNKRMLYLNSSGVGSDYDSDELKLDVKNNYTNEIDTNSYQDSTNQNRPSTSDSEYLSGNESSNDTGEDDDVVDVNKDVGEEITGDSSDGYLDSSNNPGLNADKCEGIPSRSDISETESDKGDPINEVPGGSIETSQINLVSKQGETSDERLTDDKVRCLYGEIQDDNTDERSADDKTVTRSWSPDSATIGSLDDKSVTSADDKDSDSCRVS